MATMYFSLFARVLAADGTAHALSGAIMLILEAIICAYVFGISAMLAGFRYAPEGYEDEEGFHIHWQNNTPEIRDIACVWVVPGAAS